jgi:hypothetical protein
MQLVQTYLYSDYTPRQVHFSESIKLLASLNRGFIEKNLGVHLSFLWNGGYAPTCALIDAYGLLNYLGIHLSVKIEVYDMSPTHLIYLVCKASRPTTMALQVAEADKVACIKYKSGKYIPFKNLAQRESVFVMNRQQCPKSARLRWCRSRKPIRPFIFVEAKFFEEILHLLSNELLHMYLVIADQYLTN